MSESGVTTIECNQVRFILTADKIAVETRLQFFILEPCEPYFAKRLKTIRMLIELREIDDLASLLGYSQGKILWVASSRKWLLNYAERKVREYESTNATVR